MTSPHDTDPGSKLFSQACDRMDRRRFLKWQGACALGLGAAASGLLTPSGLWAAPAEPDVAVVKGGPENAVRAAVKLLGGIERFVKPGQRVVIKPNFSFANAPEMATSTNPAVVQALVRLCQEAGAGSIAVLDHTLNAASYCLEKTGIAAACDVFAKDMARNVGEAAAYGDAAIPKAVAMSKVRVMNDVLRADVLIAAPVAKSHSSTGVSLSMKGMMGLIFDRGVMHSRYDLHESIVDLATLLVPKLVVIDAQRVLTTGGPSGPGQVDELGKIVASANMVAADATMVTEAKWYGKSFRPDQVKHIRLAAERGLGSMDVDKLRIVRMDA